MEKQSRPPKLTHLLRITHLPSNLRSRHASVKDNARSSHMNMTILDVITTSGKTCAPRFRFRKAACYLTLNYRLATLSDTSMSFEKSGRTSATASASIIILGKDTINRGGRRCSEAAEHLQKAAPAMLIVPTESMISVKLSLEY